MPLKYLLPTCFLVVGFINAYRLMDMHYDDKFDQYYEECKQSLIQDNNYQNDEQVYECMNKEIDLKILSFILMR